MGTQIISTGSPVATEHVPAGVAFEDVGRVAERIQQELQVLRKKQAAIAKRIGLIKDTITGLAKVFGPEIVGREIQSASRVASVKRPRSRGLTDACRALLKERSGSQTLKEISMRLQERYPTLLMHHKYPMAIIQIMLNRLVMYGEAEAVAGEAGLRSWRAAPATALKIGSSSSLNTQA